MSAGTNVEEVIEARLRELDEQLRPYAVLEEERTRLLAALEALRGGAGDNGRVAVAKSTTGTRQPARRKRQRSGRGKRATRGSNLEAILGHVNAHPGATASDLAEATGISRGVVYSAVSRLAAGGRLRREQLPDGQVAYHLPA